MDTNYTIVRADGTTTCCDAFTTIYVDDGVEYCKACYEPVMEREIVPHTHTWGPVEVSRLAANPHRRCECGMVTLDLGDEEG